jgi:iron complex transport system substrate-binding protein
MMMRICTFLILLWLMPVNLSLAGSEGKSYTRVVSLDYCADQFMLKLLSKPQILAVSKDAEQHFSYMREQAVGLRQVRSLAEDVLVLQPDLIVRSYGGGPNASRFFERAGVPVVQIPFANDIEAIRQSILFVATQLGEPERGKVVVKEMDERLRSIRVSSSSRKVLYMTPGGVTSGPGTLVHEMLLAAGLRNFEQQPGWRSIPLETLAYESPDLVAASFFDTNSTDPFVWSATRHPVAQRQMAQRPTVKLQGAWTTCGAWFLLDAIESLAADQFRTAGQ